MDIRKLFTMELPRLGLAKGVPRHGFRKWYERQLHASHAHMLLTFLATIALLASFEALAQAKGVDKLIDAVFILLCIGIAFWSLRRYLQLLAAIEEIANQAVCPQCGVYGRFTVVGENMRHDQARVCCKGCQTEWFIRDGE
jgi:formate dehydrogenase maturation protein FdhE